MLPLMDTLVVLNLTAQKLSEGGSSVVPTSSLGDSDLRTSQGGDVRPLPASRQLAPCLPLQGLGPREQRGAQVVTLAGVGQGASRARCCSFLGLLEGSTALGASWGVNRWGQAKPGDPGLLGTKTGSEPKDEDA